MRSSATFVPGDPRAVVAGRKGGKASRKVSPWGRVPYNHNAIRTLRLEAIKRVARKMS